MKDTANIEIPYPAYISPLCLPITIGKKEHGVNIKYPINNNPSVNLSEILKVYKLTWWPISALMTKLHTLILLHHNNIYQINI